MNIKLNNIINITGVFLLSLSLFMYEVIITRLLSTILAYHFVFITISFSILGLGIGGLLVYKSKINFKINKISFILSIIYIFIILVIYKLPYVNIFLLYSIISSLPFILGGIVLSKLFLDENKISNKLYFSDLIGSAIGSLVIIYFMDTYGFMITVFIISSISMVASLIFSIRNKDKLSIIILLAFLTLISLVNEKNNLLRLEQNFTSYLTSPITVIEYFRKKGAEDVNPIFTKWDSISRTDVIKESERQMTIITDGGASTTMVKFNDKLEELNYLKNDASYIPFSIGKSNNTLIIGSGGGKDVLYALLSGSKNIDSVEINPSTIKAVNYFKEFNGDIYNYDGVNLYIEDGRNFVEKTVKKYDKIYLSMVMTNSVNNGGMSFSENYIYTEEAFKRYFEILKDDGHLIFMFHSIQDMLRGINTGLKSLKDLGIENEKLKDQFIAINSFTNKEIKLHGNKITMPIIIFKKTPFTNNEIKNISKSIDLQDREVINLPTVKYFDIYQLLSEEGVTIKDLYKVTPFNIEPTTDNKPFFYDFSKHLPLSLISFLIFMILIVLKLLIKLRKNKKIMKHVMYFSLIGIGFMLIEIPLIQKSILYIGNPAKAFSYILFSILLSSGLGSYFSNKKIFNIKINGKKIIFILIPIIALWSYYLLSNTMFNFIDISMTNKLLLFFILLFPLGFFMGMALPHGIRDLATKELQKYIPLVWGVNGILSVFGSVLALAISMSYGYNITIAIGALTYLSVIFID